MRRNERRAAALYHVQLDETGRRVFREPLSFAVTASLLAAINARNPDRRPRARSQ